MASQPGFLELISLGATGYGDELLWGALTTVQIAVCAYALGLLIGVCGALGKLNGSKLTRATLQGYTTVVRAVPELILILILYFAGTASLNHLLQFLGYGSFTLDGFVSAVVVLGFVQGAYSTEVLRAAIQSIPIGQLEAARALGMSPMQEFMRITVPALLPFALPGLANLWVVVTKDTALIAVVGYSELALVTRQAAGNTKEFLGFYLVAAALYLLITLVSVRLFSLLECRVRRGQPKLA